jgi:hypothetical protein
MTIKINDSRPVPKGGRKIVTRSEAEEVGAFELARQWADRLSWPALDRTAADELAELACMSALARWLLRWQPIHIHRAVLAGADPAAVASALGSTNDGTFQCWHQWAARQRKSFIGGIAGVTADDYEAIVRAFATAGVTVSGQESQHG